MRKQKLCLFYCIILTVSLLMGCKNQADKAQDTDTIQETEAEKTNPTKESDSSRETTASKTEASDETESTEASADTQTSHNESAGTETSVNIQTSQTENVTDAEGAENDTTTQEIRYSFAGISKVMYAVSAVNVRNMPSVDGQRLGSLKAEQEVSVTGQCNETGWYRINFNGQTGYVSNNYLTDEKPTEAPTTAKPDEPATTVATNITDTSPTDPSGLVSVSNLANISSLKRKCTDQEFQAAYDAAVQIVTPLIGLSREEQLMGIAAALRNMVDSGQVEYSTQAAHYDDPYGYLVLGVASCAGCTRTTGLCLNMLNIPYEHVNENQWSHQWCRVNVNGTYWICDAYGLYVGPEPEPYVHPYIQ